MQTPDDPASSGWTHNTAEGDATPPPPPPPPVGVPSAVPPGRPPRRITRKWWWIGGGAAIALIILIAALGATKTGTPTATNTNASPSPTSTETPTSPPTPTPTPTPPPTPDPTAVLSGRGDSVVAVPAPYDTAAGLLTATYNGADNFIVEPLSADNTTGGSLFNKIGRYKGTIAFDILQGQAASRLKITANGAWTLTFADISTAPVAASVISGKGDSVILYLGPAATMHVTHNGVGNFIVDEIPTAAGSQTNNLLNEIGQYNGVIPVEAGPALFAITADGAFTFTPS